MTYIPFICPQCQFSNLIDRVLLEEFAQGITTLPTFPILLQAPVFEHVILGPVGDLDIPMKSTWKLDFCQTRELS